MPHPVRRRQFLKFGPRKIEQVPISHFQKRGGKEFDEQLKQLWEIIGPSVQLNLDRLPLWKVICMAYFEGGVHAVQMMEEQRDE